VTELETAVRLAVAGLSGMAVGVEREWSGHATGPQARFAGVRTFLLLGTLGGVAGWLLDSAGALAAAALLAGAAGLIVAAYLTAARRAPEAIDGTTETAALLVLAIGTLAGLGSLRVASGAAAVAVLALGEKQIIRDFVSRIGQKEMRAALQFAVLALVVLPLLPVGPIGPFGGIRPRDLWAVVLLFSGLNFAGYIARRVLGDTGGYQAMGALGGLVSSTAVTLSFSRQSRAEPANSNALAVGTVAACTVLIPRILGFTLILNAALLPSAALALAPVFAAGALLIVIGRRHLAGGTPEAAAPPHQNPLRLWSAIRMAVAFQIILSVLSLLGESPGERGVFLSAGIAGLTDMDALTFGMNKIAGDSSLISVAARALTIGVVVNTVFKTGLAAVLGSPAYRRMAVPGLLALAAAGALGFWLITWVSLRM
jgi:uncharacterized membrane protein (DUF4010 family)